MHPIWPFPPLPSRNKLAPIRHHHQQQPPPPTPRRNVVPDPGSWQNRRSGRNVPRPTTGNERGWESWTPPSTACAICCQNTETTGSLASSKPSRSLRTISRPWTTCWRLLNKGQLVKGVLFQSCNLLERQFNTGRFSPWSYKLSVKLKDWKLQKILTAHTSNTL